MNPARHSPVPAGSPVAFHSARAPEPVDQYPHTRRVRRLFLSGTGPRQRGQAAVPGLEPDAAGRIRRYGFENQFHAVPQNVRYLLEAAGAPPCPTTIEVNCRPMPIAIGLKFNEQ